MVGDKEIGDDDVSKKSVDIAGNEQFVDEDASKKSVDMAGDKKIGDDVSKKSVDIAGNEQFVDEDASKKSVDMAGDKKIGDDVSKKSVAIACDEKFVGHDASKKCVDMAGDEKIGDDDVTKKSVAMARDEQFVDDDASKKSVDMAGPKKIVDDDVSMKMVDITREKNDYLSDNTHQTLEDDVCSNESYIFSDGDGESDRQLLEAARAAETLLENENVDISENIPSSDLEADADKENGKSGQIESLKMLCVENKDTSVDFRPVSFDRQKESEIEVGEGIQNELPLSPLFESENNINETQPRISMEEYRLRNERLLQADEIHKNVTVGVSQSCATVAQSPNRTELEPNICDTELTIEGKTTKGK